MKKIFTTVLFMFSILLLRAQCGDVLVTFNYKEGDCGDESTKTVRHFSPSGKIISEEIYFK